MVRRESAPLIRLLTAPASRPASAAAVRLVPGLFAPTLGCLAALLTLLVPVLAGAPPGAASQVAAAALVAGLLTLVAASRAAGHLQLRQLPVPGPPSEDTPRPIPAWVVTRVPCTPRRPRAPGGRLPR